MTSPDTIETEGRPMSNFHVGQKVVLIDDTTHSHGIDRSISRTVGADVPKKGEVYTVRFIAIETDTGRELLLLNEINNAAASRRLGYAKELGFAASRFRPVVERKTDISIFRAMLNPSKQKEQA